MIKEVGKVSKETLGFDPGPKPDQIVGKPPVRELP